MHDTSSKVRHLPLWAPGSGFLRKAALWRAKMEEFVDKPYEMVKQRMASVEDQLSTIYGLD